jgi:uncharacterized protein (TIGR00297 family)
MNLLLAVLLSNIFCQVAYYKKWLDVSGALAATIMGSVILAAGQWKLALPMLLFFLTGSLFSKFRKNVVVADAKSKKPRDYLQVFCNGGIAMACLILYLVVNDSIFIAAYFLSIAISTSDTWSSEIGMWVGGKVIDIVNGKGLPKGISGGVSFVGTLAGFMGSLLIALPYYLFFNSNYCLFGVVVFCGFAGMLLDSIIGSRLQARYRTQNGSYAEYILENENVKPDKGFAWITNDLVNLLSNIIMTIIGTVFLLKCKV